jgi:hypothetical protein
MLTFVIVVNDNTLLQPFAHTPVVLVAMCRIGLLDPIPEGCAAGTASLISGRVLRTAVFALTMDHPSGPEMVDALPFFPGYHPADDHKDQCGQHQGEADYQEPRFCHQPGKKKTEGEEAHHAGQTIEQHRHGLGVRIGVVIDRRNTGQVASAIGADLGPWL